MHDIRSVGSQKTHDTKHITESRHIQELKNYYSGIPVKMNTLQQENNTITIETRNNTNCLWISARRCE